MEKLTAEHRIILGGMSKKKDIRAFIYNNYYNDDAVALLSSYYKYRGLDTINRKPIIPNDNNVPISKNDNQYRVGFNNGYAEGLKKGVEKAMMIFLYNQLRCEDFLKTDEYVKLIKD